MTATTHALTGALIATLVRRPAYAIPLAFISHFICDALPHFGLRMHFGSPAMYVWLVLDGIALVSIALFLARKKVKRQKLLAISAFAAMIPDLAWFYYGVRYTLSDTADMDILSRFHSHIQWAESPIGITVDLLWVGLAVWIILKWNQHEDNQHKATSKA